MKSLVRLTAIILMAGLMIGLWISPGTAKPTQRNNGEFNEIKELQADIKSLNLVSNLYLSDEQEAKLIPLIKEAQDLRTNFRDLVSQRESEMKEVLYSMRQEIETTNDVTPETKKKFHQLKGLIEERKDSMDDRMDEIIGEVKGLLTENQKVMISEYSPCLVPKKSATNPERIGQAGDISHLEKILGRIRQIPDERYTQIKERILARASKKIKKKFKGEDADQKLQEFSRVLDEARAMNDEEFEIKKTELASSMKPQHKVAKGKQFDRFIMNFILNPNVASYLEKNSATGKGIVNGKIEGDAGVKQQTGKITPN